MFLIHVRIVHDMYYKYLFSSGHYLARKKKTDCGGIYSPLRKKVKIIRQINCCYRATKIQRKKINLTKRY